MYRTRTWPGWSLVGGGVGSRARRSMAKRKAASVLPLPVGAWMSVCSPRAIASQPRACASVGASKLASNHARTAGENGASGSAGTIVATGPASIGLVACLDHLFDFAPARGRALLATGPCSLGANEFEPVTHARRQRSLAANDSAAERSGRRCEGFQCSLTANTSVLAGSIGES